jgi:uncharacterized membrane protein YdfJ with MMPL/SSD domain
MSKKWMIIAGILLFIGVLTLVAFPLIATTKQKAAIRKQYEALKQSSMRQLNDLQSPTVLKALPPANKGVIDSVLKYYKEVLGSISTTMGLFITLKQFLIGKKKKRVLHKT